MLSVVIAPEVYTGAAELATEVERYLEFVKSSRPRAPGGAVLLSGEPEQRARAERSAKGVPIDPTTWNHIMAAGERLGLARAELEALAA
jgi:hydroxycarboxylate dehydrogenase B